MRIGLASPQEVDGLWPHLVEKFSLAINDHGDDLPVSDLWQMCRSGNAFLMCAMDGSKPVMGAVLQFQKWGNGPVLRCLTIGGEDMASWVSDFEMAVMKMMAEGGARRFVFDGRDGWARMLKHLKPKKLRTTYEVEIR